MPHPDYRYQAGVAIGCEGPSAGLVRTGPLGVRRSRDGAHLEHVLADAQHWYKEFKRDEEGGRDERQSGVDPFVVLLENPTRAAVADAIAECGAFLRRFRDRPDWAGGTFHFAFAGHGTDAGDLVLADGGLSPDELAELAAASVDPNPPAKRRLGLVFDSCFSALTLARIMLHPFRRSRLLITDGFAAAMHDELAWELDSLGHGALTFSMANRGNAHVDRDRLAKAVEQGDEIYLRLALQGFVPNPVSYLTDADQHSLDLINGHWLEIKGLGVVEVLGDASLDQLLDALERVRSDPRPRLQNMIELRG
jgi:hypothetical protein